MKHSFNRRLTVGDVAQRLQVHIATVWRWVHQGVRGRRLKSRLLGGRRYLLEQDLDAFLATEQQDPFSLDRNHRADIAGIVLDSRRVRVRKGADPNNPIRR